MVSEIEEEEYDSSTNSMDDILRELDKEKIHIIISKDIRRFGKIATVVKGLQGRKDIELITKEIKTKIGTGVHIKMVRLSYKATIVNMLKSSFCKKDIMRNQLK
jgi:translation initiation factor 1 (eIF-1/SUI1)